MKVPFYKCNSKGNTFIVVCHPFKFVPLINKNQIIDIYNSLNNSRVDGVILLNSDFKSLNMDYYNNDGSWETFCLNGLICSALVINDHCPESLIINNNYNISSNEIRYHFQILEKKLVKVQLDHPTIMSFNNKKGWLASLNNNFNSVKIDNFNCHYINSGAKHIVIKSKDDLLFDNDSDLEKKLKKIRYNKLFLPDGVNVNIYRCINSNTIQVKTYEKGIESMMESCASGSYACAYAYSRENNCNKKINVINDGGNSLIIFGEDYNKSFYISKGIIEYKGELEI